MYLLSEICFLLLDVNYIYDAIVVLRNDAIQDIADLREMCINLYIAAKYYRTR